MNQKFSLFHSRLNSPLTWQGLFMAIVLGMFSGKKMEWVAGGISMVLANCFSPTWWLMNMVMKPYCDMKKLLTGVDPIGQYLAMQHAIKAAGPETLFFSLIPALILCLLIGTAYYAAFTWLGVRVIKRIASRFNAQPA